jgi:hypothetical protein
VQEQVKNSSDPHLNQKHDCPESQVEVPLAQLHPHPSVPGGLQPEGVCGSQPLVCGVVTQVVSVQLVQSAAYGNQPPSFQPGSRRSTALRETGMTIDMCAET